jgi:hypothetical protein
MKAPRRDKGPGELMSFADANLGGLPQSWPQWMKSQITVGRVTILVGLAAIIVSAVVTILVK